MHTSTPQSSPSKRPSPAQLKFASKVAGQARVFGPPELVDAAPNLETATAKEINVYLDLFEKLDVSADKQWASERTLKALKDKGKLLPDMSWTTSELRASPASCIRPVCRPPGRAFRMSSRNFFGVSTNGEHLSASSVL